MQAKSATDSGRKKLNAGQIDAVALLQTDEGAKDDNQTDSYGVTLCPFLLVVRKTCLWGKYGFLETNI
jgi:hypothetical protein